MPGPVYEILLTLAKLGSFELFSPDEIIGWLFSDGFTETESVNAGWEAMDSDSKICVSNLGMLFLIGLFTALNYTAYALLWFTSTCAKVLEPLRKKMALSLFWGALLIFALEGYLDFALASLANLEAPFLMTWSDMINFIFCVMAIALVLCFPLWAFCFLCSNKNKVNQNEF